LDAYGREVDRQAGYGGKEKLSTRMQKNSKGEDALEKLFTKYLEDKADAEPIFSIAEIRMDQMKVQEATFLLNSTSPQQLTSPATQARYDFLMGRAHYLKSDFKKASDYLLDYIKSDYAEEEGTALRWLEKCSKRLDQSQLIYDAYEIVIQKDPEDFHTMNSFAWSASQEKIHLDKALPYAKKAVELSEHSPGILDTLAEVYYALGELEQAIATEKLALEKDPKEKEFQNRILKYEQALKSKSSSKTVTQ
jgi:tetratricopeptide (TPR) repeat protein